MLRWALIFLIVALIAAVFGFGGIATGAAGIAKILFVLFLVVFVISLILGAVGALVFGIVQLATPAYDWAGKAPQSLRRIESRIRDLRKPVQTMSRATQQVENMTKAAGVPDTAKVQVTTESLGARVLSGA